MSDLFLSRDTTLPGAKVPVRRRGLLGKIQTWLEANRVVMRVIVTLFSATMLARLASGFSILVSVLLFAPAEFARFGMLLAGLTLCSAVQFLRYETLIVAAKNSQDLRLAVRLTAMVGVLVWLAVALLAALATSAGLVGIDMAVLFLAALATRGICRVVSQIVIRKGDFRALGLSVVALACVQPTVLVLSWLVGASGAVAMGMTDVVGNFAACLFLIWPSRHVLRDAWRRKVGDMPLVQAARRWSDVPVYNLPSTLLAVAFTSVPLLVVLLVAEAHVAGHVALVFRILDVPVQIIAAVISPIAMNRFHLNRGHFLSVHAPMLVGGLLVAVTGVFGGICLLAFAIEPWLTDTSWAGLSHFLPQIACFQASIALAIPLIEIANLRSNQRALLIVQAMAVGAIILLAATVGNWQTAITAFCWVGAFRALLLAAPLLGWRAPRSETASATHQRAHMHGH